MFNSVLTSDIASQLILHIIKLQTATVKLQNIEVNFNKDPVLILLPIALITIAGTW